VLGADAASDAARDVDAAAPPPDAAPDLRRDVVAAETTPDVVAAETTPDVAPDVARDVVAESPPDIAADAPRDSVVGGDADRPGEGGIVPPGRALSLISNWPVSQTSGSSGLTVDAANRVFRADSSYIYLLEGGLFRTYMSIAEALAGVRLNEPGRFVDIDFGSDGMLYILLNGNAGDAVPAALVVGRSSGAHTATRLLDFRPDDATVMRVIAPGQVGIFHVSGGLFTASPGGQQLVYVDPNLGASCGRGNITRGVLAVGPSGLFLFSRGCDSAPILRGNFDGSGVIGLYKPSAPPVSADDFICLARDPAGGFYTMVTGDGTGTTPTSGTRLYHVADDAAGASGFTPVATTPSFDEARIRKVDKAVFTTCALAAAPDGTVYVQTLNELWKIAP